MGHKIFDQNKKGMGMKDDSWKDDFKFTDVTKEELDERRIPVYSYLL